MTTYTITQEQRKQLMDALEPHKSTVLRWVTEEDAALSLLQSLQPNTQEPVAEVLRGIQKDQIVYLVSPESLPHNTKLYTHSRPQQKPLTDEQIDQCEIAAGVTYRRHQGSVRGQQLTPADDFLYHFAKAIEAAHNIGVKP